MNIEIPIIRSVDVLFVGGSVSAVCRAVDLQKKGFKTAVISSYPYMGEDLCAYFDLQTEKTPDFIRMVGEGFYTPNQIKTALERNLVNADIFFLYQTYPVCPLLDEKNRISGMLFCSRSGFQGIEAKVIVDSTNRQTACRVCGLPMKKFMPGTYQVERYFLSEDCPADKDLVCEKLPKKYIVRGKKHIVFHAAAQLYFSDNSFGTRSKNEIKMREMTWTPTLSYAADKCRMLLNDGVDAEWTPTDERMVLPISRASLDNITGYVLRKKQASSVSVAGSDVPGIKDIDVVRKDSFFRFQKCRKIMFDLNSLPVLEETDVFVCGGGTGGAPAAIAAGREGVKVICSEYSPNLGGLCTVGRICSYWYGNRVGFTQEMANGIYKMGKNPKYPADDSRANVEWKQEYLLREIQKAGQEVRFGTLVTAVLMRGNSLCGAVLATEDGIGCVLAKNVVDASGNADMAAMAGGKTVMASKDEPSVQGAGIMPIDPGNDYTNSDYQFICDHDVLDFTRAMVMGRGKYPEYFDMTQIAGTRERRRIVGEITLQPQDFYAHRCYSDTINEAMSNFDTHGYIVHPMFLLKPTSEDSHYAKVPFRAFLPVGLENILATGLSVSAHRDCIPLIRMQPDVQNHGFAAGLAAAMQAKDSKTFREIDIRNLQKKLIENGCLKSEVLTETDSIPGPDSDDPHCMLSNVFLNPEKSLPEIKKQYTETKSNDLAMLLAFLGEKDGADQIEDEISKTPWDTGWNYRGMGQFGMSSSPLDVMILALQNVKPESPVMMQKLLELYPDHEFSHFRAICISLIRHPNHHASHKLAELLSIPGMSGFAIKSYKDSLLANRSVCHENSVRNSQLKELYLAKALHRCSPENQDAIRILEEYKEGLIGCYSVFAQSI